MASSEDLLKKSMVKLTAINEMARSCCDTEHINSAFGLCILSHLKVGLSILSHLKAITRHNEDYYGNNKDFACEQCNYRSDKKCDLEDHIKSVHDAGVALETLNELYCNQCAYKTFIKVEFKQHMRVSHGHVTCEQCIYHTINSYQGRHHMKRHVKEVHDIVKDFTCQQCGLKTTRRDNLERHVKAVHDKVKDFTCQ